MRVSVIGAGGMGAAITERLLSAGHSVSVWNRSPERLMPLLALGASRLDDLESAWADADACIVSVADSDALLAVTIESGVGGSAGGEGRLLIDTSTVSPQSSMQVAAAASANGIGFLRAPVSGSPALVRAGTAMMIVSGDEADFDSGRPLLAQIAGDLRYVGTGETARVVKLALNSMIAGTAQLLSEAIVLVEANGIDLSRFLEVAANSAIGSPLIKYKAPAIAAGDFRPAFSVRLMRKDVELAISAGRRAGVPMPATSLVAGRLDDAISIGLGGRDFSALVEVLREETGAL